MPKAVAVMWGFIWLYSSTTVQIIYLSEIDEIDIDENWGYL
jgi:hypothetical protein